ncbi:MAG: hypothetical protein ACO3N7_02795 [Kiritimatiellia bacterium]
MTACDWSSGSQESFNTSGGSNNVNISGFYRGINGGRLVSQTSNGNILSMTIQQSGNRVDVIDNQGSKYQGSIGAPLVSDVVNGSVLNAGATVASYQISFSGRDGVAGRDINFTGVLTILAVSDIDSSTGTSTSGVNNSTNTNTVTAPTPPATGTGTTVNNTTTQVGTTTTSYTYDLTGPSSQLQLQGTWSEVGGVTSSVNGFGPPAQGNITVTTTATAP